MVRATEFAHLVVRRSVDAGDWAVDATVGNGHDTLLLAELVGPSGHVFGFDVQEAALETAAQRIGDLSQVTLFHAGHENLAEHVPDNRGVGAAAVMFNLGYLPGGTKDVKTRPDTTLAALQQSLACLKVGGVATLVLYRGHPGGAEEAASVRSYAERLPQIFDVAVFAQIRSLRPAPELLVIERLA